MKLIIHADINNFYASVECAMTPELSTLPVAVAGNIEKRSGIILAKNYLAKAKGVQTGEAIWQAKQKCPNLVTVLPNYSAYRHYSRVIIAIYEQYTDKIEGMGLDECWLDMTKSIHLFVKDTGQGLFEQGKEFAQILQKEVEQKTSLGISIGVSFGKLFAKMASDMKKPKGIVVISPQNFKQIVYPCPVKDALGVGRQTDKALAKMNLRTLGDVANANPDILKKRFGIVGLQLQQKLQGNDNDEVGIFYKAPPPKSVGNGTTLVKDSVNIEEIAAVIAMLSSQIAMRLREANLGAGCISVGVKTNEFETFAHEKKLPFLTDDEIDISCFALKILQEFWHFKKPIRSIRICTSKLSSTKHFVQLSFLQSEHKLSFNKAIDSLRNKHSYNIIKTAKSATCPKVSQSFD